MQWPPALQLLVGREPASGSFKSPGLPLPLPTLFIWLIYICCVQGTSLKELTTNPQPLTHLQKMDLRFLGGQTSSKLSSSHAHTQNGFLSHNPGVDTLSIPVMVPGRKFQLVPCAQSLIDRPSLWTAGKGGVWGDEGGWSSVGASRRAGAETVEALRGARPQPQGRANLEHRQSMAHVISIRSRWWIPDDGRQSTCFGCPEWGSRGGRETVQNTSSSGKFKGPSLLSSNNCKVTF